ncbi:acid protease, partial [Amniculicola lignicola CBS 123094]
VVPVPYVVQPSGSFDGNDGKWSSFFINIGDDATGQGQTFRLLPATSSPLTLVPDRSGWCNDEECAANRGIEKTSVGRQPLEFEEQSSKAWAFKGLFTIPLPLDLQWQPDQKPNGSWGLDNVGLGRSSRDSQILADQVVVQYTSKDFYMGWFGLAALPVNPSGGGNLFPFLPNYANATKIPSTSYGYTAGASYREDTKGVEGSLTLGGYDQSRFRDQGVSITMPSTGNNTLVVGVQSIAVHPDPDVDDNEYSFTKQNPNGFFAAIDSTLPYLWLPDDVCDKFANYFRLTYDSKQNLYLVNESSHTHNIQQNATLGILVGATSGMSIESTTITLPYLAFDLNLSAPTVENSTRYFPLKKSPTGVYVLGRTFLQEAYITVDYERSNFTVSPANFTDPMPEPHIIPIYTKGYVPPTTTPPPTPNPKSKDSLGAGAIAGIVVGVIVFFLLLGLGFLIIWKRRRDQRPKTFQEKPLEIDTIVAGEEVKLRRVSELDSNEPGSPKANPGGYYANGEKEPPISEMESPPVELYSPPPETPSQNGHGGDFFTIGGKLRRRAATRENSGNNHVLAELPGDEAYAAAAQTPASNSPIVSPLVERPLHSRHASNATSQVGIDETLDRERRAEEERVSNELNEEDERGAGGDVAPARRPSQHARGPSDAPTMASDSTAVSLPSPEEREAWAGNVSPEPRRPLS